MEIRALVPDDRASLEQFLRRIPTADRTFFKEEVEDPAVIASWVDDDAARWIATDSDAVLGYASVTPLHGLSDHVGEIRLIVDPGPLREGLGMGLARETVLGGLRLGLSKLVVEVLATESYTIEMFRSLGFDPEALLTDHVRSPEGSHLDLMILAHSSAAASAAMAASGLADGL